MEKISALWALLRQGEEVADPAKWKMRQITATALAGVLIAMVNVLKSFGYELPIDQDTANAIAAGVLALFNVVLTVVTTKKIGLQSIDQAAPEADGGAARAESESGRGG